MRLSELQNKKIISIVTGKNIGNIVDCEINDNGGIDGFIIQSNKGVFSLSREQDSKILWGDITKIGEDVILVRKV